MGVSLLGVGAREESTAGLEGDSTPTRSSRRLQASSGPEHEGLASARGSRHALPSSATRGARMAVRPTPQGYHTITPFIVAQGAAKLIDFLKQGFGAEEIERMAAPDGTVMHAEVRIGDSIVMLGEA